ncbi:sulfotransferase domain-containing protein [Cerasicoccus frondis]|uniref:sulfotransferase domain-containing protein n=1 Tax=Cerasicoccus frondis TaxID=490090 RepID=UPI002852C2BB|nr:sulfotransferase domain-containing protein [Cerasicoccus frondis]
MVVWLYSYPRSGNTLLRILTHSYFGLDTYSVHSTTNEGDKEFNREGTAKFMGQKPIPGTWEECQASDDVFLVKTHALPPDYGKVVHLHRDGRDALVSYAHYYMKYILPEKNKLLYKLKGKPTDVSAAITYFLPKKEDSWSDHAKAVKTLSNPILELRYQDLVDQPDESMALLAEFIGINQDAGHAKPPTFEELNASSPGFFRKGASGSWKDEMTDAQHELFWQYHGDVMRELGYER